MSKRIFDRGESGIDRSPGGEKASAVDLCSRRIRRQRRLDVLRPESKRMLHARSPRSSTKSSRQQTLGNSRGTTDQVRLCYESQNRQANWFEHSTQRLNQGGSSHPMNLESRIGNRKSKIVRIPP